ASPAHARVHQASRPNENPQHRTRILCHEDAPQLPPPAAPLYRVRYINPPAYALPTIVTSEQWDGRQHGREKDDKDYISRLGIDLWFGAPTRVFAFGSGQGVQSTGRLSLAT